MSESQPSSFKRILKQDWPILLLLAASWAYALWAYPQMPDRVPIHWNIHGEPDGWGAPGVNVFMLGIISVGTWLLMAFIPKIDPRGASLLEAGTSYKFIRWLVTGLMAGLHVMIVHATLTESQSMDGPMEVLLGLFFMGFGNVMGRVPANYMVGVRTPWTLNDPEIWRKTHRTTGRVWFVGGLLLALSGLFLEGAVMGYTFLAIITGLITIPLIQSYVLYKRSQA